MSESIKDIIKQESILIRDQMPFLGMTALDNPANYKYSYASVLRIAKAAYALGGRDTAEETARCLKIIHDAKDAS